MIEAASTLLPVAPFLPEIVSRLGAKGGLVLQAEPGAGKTSLVPLALAYGARIAGGAEARGLPGKVIVLEPRRVAAVQAAARAEELLLDFPPGDARREIGYRVRGDSRPGSRLEFVTSGVFLRMIQGDPGLTGVSCVVFDEFHERSLDGDLSLALALEARLLAPSLKLLLMSATIEAERAAAFIGAESLGIPGRSYPVETSYRAIDSGRGFAAAVASAASGLADSVEGDLLVFLPGLAEIGAVGRELSALGRDSTPLHASLPLEEQRRVIDPRRAS
jgi:ATP-dependent helicase HrpB